MRGFAAAALLALGAALFIRCSSDDTSCADASCDVSISPLVLTLEPAEVWAHPGDVVSVAIDLTRGPGGDGDAVVTLGDDAGAAVTADPLTVPAGNVVGTLTVHVGVAQGDADMVVTATAGAAVAQAAFVVHVAGASGAPDTTFGSGGVADLSPSSGFDVAAAMIALQSGVLVGGTHVETDDAGQTSSMKVLQLTSGGTVDGSFSPTSSPGELWSIARMPDGRVYAVGAERSPKADFAAVRVLASGGLDPTYAVVTPITLGDDIARAAIVEPGGRLTVTGPVGDASAIGLARYTQVPLPKPDAGVDASDDADADLDADLDAEADGDADASVDAPVDQVTSHLDPTFADGGVAIAALAKPSAGSSAMLVGPDGSLWVLGYQQDTTTDVAALHFDTTGALLATTTLPLTSGTYGAAAAVLAPDGSIAIATDDNGQSLVMRILPSGDLDPSFGVGGLAAVAAGASSGARALARDPASGDLYVGGFTGAPHQCFVARVSATGAVDAHFASAGVLSISSGDACDVAALAVDDAGKLLVLETVTAAGNTHMAVARYWP